MSTDHLNMKSHGIVDVVVCQYKVMAEKVGDRDIDSVKTTGASTTGASFKITDGTAQIATTDQTFRRNIAP